jgi:uridine phosphorylase
MEEKEKLDILIDDEGRTHHLCINRDNIAKKIFVVGDPERTEKVAKYFDDVTFKTKNREMITITGAYKGVPMSVISTGIGTDNVEIVLTELHILNEYDVKNKSWKKEYEPLTVIRIGTCGCPQNDIDVGAMAITSYAVGLDNTGIYYPHTYDDKTLEDIKEEFMKTELAQVHPYFSKSSPEVVDALEEEAKNTSRKSVTGITVSASGFYAPQGRKIGRLGNILIPNLEEVVGKIRVNGDKREERVVSSEMESSCLNRLCNILDYQSGTICAILATRAEGHQKLISKEEYENSVEDCINAALEAMLKL